jgi:mRNA interferase RelE/StbE
MTNYEVEFTNSAQRELSKHSPPIAIRLVRAIDRLSFNPRTGNVRPMVGSKSWRLRVGDYRVVYDILDQRLVILIIKIGHRREVYR